MRRGQNVPVTHRLDRSREATKRALARDILSGCVMARIWPSYLTTPRYANPQYPLLLCVSSPAGLLVWRVALEERALVEDWLPLRPRTTEQALDRIPVLQTLAENGW